MIKEMSFGNDVLDPLPFYEVIQAFDAPAQQEVNKISYFLSKVLIMLYFVICKVKKYYWIPWMH
jgi:hypothetical protein